MMVTMSELAFGAKGVAEQAGSEAGDCLSGKSLLIPSFSNILKFDLAHQLRRKDSPGSAAAQARF